MPRPRAEHLTQKIAAIRSEMRKLRKIEAQLSEHGGQVSRTDPDARSMNSARKGTGTVGYNVQSAVDTKNRLIVAHEVTNVGKDRAQLFDMARRTRKAIGAKDLTALGDRSYFSGEEILKCERAGMTPMVPKPLTSGGKADGRFDKRDSVYNARRVSLSSRPACGLAIHSGRERVNPTSVLVVRLSSMPHQGEVYPVGLSRNQPLGAGAGSRGHAAQARQSSGDGASASTDCRASIWNPEGVDGSDTFPDEDAPTGQNGDELARSGLQHKESDEYPGNRRGSEDAHGLIDSSVIRDHRPGAAERCSWQ